MSDRSRGSRTVIQEDVAIKGAMLTDGEVELNGLVDGAICAKVVEIGASAKMKGEIVAETATVSGRVEGRITARMIRLATGAHIVGDLIHQRLAIEDGAEFEGSVLRKKEDEAWVDITRTFEIEGVELTDDAARAVQALSDELDNVAGNGRIS